MKNKKNFVLICLILSALAACLCACNKKDNVFVDTGIELYYAKQYYVEGEKFTPEGGLLKVNTYNAKKQEESYRLIDLTDSEVTLINTTASRVGTHVVTVNYKGFETQFKYIVQEEENAVESVSFVVGEDSGAPVYSVSNIRDEIDFEDFIGMKFIIKYRNKKINDVELSLADKENYYYDEGIDYTGFDVSTAGMKNITFTLFATDAVVPYKVTETDFIYDYEFVKYNSYYNDYDVVAKSDSVRTNYLVGEEFDAQNTKIRYIYKSLKKAEPVDVSASDCVSYFDTTSPAEGKTFYLSTLVGVESFLYDVYEKDDIKGVAINNKDFDTPTPGFLYVWTEKTASGYKTYEQYISEIKLCLVADEKGEKTIPVTGADEEDIALYYIVPDEKDLSLKKEFTKEVYDEIKKTACEYEIIAVYKKNPDAYTRRIFFTTLNFVTRIDFENWGDIKTSYISGETFSFGNAKATVRYADGKTVEVLLQDEYEKGSNDERYVRINDKYAIEAKSFDMSVGKHEKQYYVAISGYEIYIDGEKYVTDTGRLYINYVVK